MRVAGLFAGIGGIELGLAASGHHAELLCEIDEGAATVLRAHFPDVDLHDDVRTVRLPDVDVVAAGFPCQDLSQAGRTAGIDGLRSSLVGEVFRRLPRTGGPRWVLIENVPFMLSLQRGKAMTVVTSALTELGYRWAYRVVDSRAFGLAQRRRRVLLLASRVDDPRAVLMADDAGPPVGDRGDLTDVACGFYWTEGERGLGWAVDAVPTLKGGSAIGIPSPPAVWMPGTPRRIVTPGVEDAEALQGFERGWTSPVHALSRSLGRRWKLVGNAVSVPVSRWVGGRLEHPGEPLAVPATPRSGNGTWPSAAWADRDGVVHEIEISEWPRREPRPHLVDVLRNPAPLSARAAGGFLRRARRGRLRFVDGFLDDVAAHCDWVGDMDPQELPGRLAVA